MLSMILSLLLSLAVNAQTSPDWSREATVTPGETRANIYQVEEAQLNQLRDNGYIHAMKYPVEVTGLLIPYRPFLNVLNADTRNPIRQVILAITKGYAGFKTEDEFYQWLGLSKFNSPNAVGIYKMPRPADQPNSLYVGAGIIKNASGEGLTFSCFACHSANLFGTTVMGLTNKKPHSNKLFHMARRVIPNVPNAMFVLGGKASRGELDMFIRTKANILSVDSVLPQVYGLDTSLPHTALSLARRNNDEYASKNPNLEKYPRENELSTFVADSKPMPWWNLKYKTRWLSDGSVVSGNPIFTNILWNEIGRGTDLRELESWMKNNSKKIEELTAAAFATEAPRYTDFFPMGSINIESAKRGQALYNQSCLKCHGDYQKGWQAPNAAELNDNDLIKTTKVVYHEKTPVRDVGTDPQRYEAMKYFADDLNNLAISKWMKTVVEPQKGYVPPPLIGVWSRWPYFHNNSVPTLCGVLSLEKDRPKTFYLGGADNINTDFDQECNGYPTGAKTPVAWTKDADSKFDTTKPGLRNSGHTTMLVDANGNEKFSAQDKKDIVMFLKTL